jgi:tRNA threonylcarbamoyladenosine biosynthesis protein TsaE
MEPISFSYNWPAIGEAALWLWQRIGTDRVVALHGPMGAGKTSLVYAICEILGVKNAVSSPTFSLINEYEIPGGGQIVHIDLYRIRDEEEALQAGMEDALYSGAWCFVEWPEKAPGIFPEDTLHVTLSVNEDQSRTIRINS